MGCDIHMFIEVRNEDGTWFSDGEELDLGRNYDMFGVAAGVRNPLISRRLNGVERAWMRIKGYTLGISKGLPEDLSKQISKEWEEHGEHTPSWCTIDEAQFWVNYYEDYCNKYQDECYSHDWQEVIDEARKLEVNGDEVRLVFWFDS